MNAIVTTNAQGDFLRRVTPALAAQRLARAMHRLKYDNPRDPMYRWDNLSMQYRTRLEGQAGDLIEALFEPIPPDEEPQPISVDALQEILG